MAAIQVAPVHARFWSKVEVRGPLQCWPWKAGRSRKGYGLFRLDGRSITASRAAWIITFDERPPDDVLVCHRCDNPPCCNPAHLFLGTIHDNMNDMRAKGRHPHGDSHPLRKRPELILRGEQRPNAKLNPQLIEWAHDERAKGRLQREIAADLGVVQSCISQALSGARWAHLRSAPIEVA